MTDQELIERLRAISTIPAVVAAERLERDRHGHHAFMGSSSWNDYCWARRQAEEALAIAQGDKA